MFQHRPVMLAEVLEMLFVAPGGVYVDGTLGGGGHSEAILSAGGTLYGIDRDRDAIEAATARLSRHPGFHAVHGNFHDLRALLAAQNVCSVQGVLLDLGVSSYQLDTAARGFSYHMNAPLDMRMDQTEPFTAADLCNTWPEAEIARALRDFGEEPWAARIAAIIVEHRPLATTDDLVRAVDAAIPRKVRDKDKGHSAQKTFQALRIAVNDELAPLQKTLEDAVSLLSPGGRLCVLTFHSLEDRIVKQTLRRLERPCTCPPGMPVCVCGKTPVVRLPSRSAISPSDSEVRDNPRARSAKLRVAEKR